MMTMMMVTMIVAGGNRYCSMELAREVSEESLDKLEAAHAQLMSVLGEQYLLNPEWDVAVSGPLRRRDHSLADEY